MALDPTDGHGECGSFTYHYPPAEYSTGGGFDLQLVSPLWLLWIIRFSSSSCFASSYDPYFHRVTSWTLGSHSKADYLIITVVPCKILSVLLVHVVNHFPISLFNSHFSFLHILIPTFRMSLR